MELAACVHPCDFRLLQWRDNGWGDMAFAYGWRATSETSDGTFEGNTEGNSEEGKLGETLPALAHCVLFEVTSYASNVGRYEAGWFFPPDPPFVGWKFRDPTDGRTGPVGMECFSASLGRAWDRHKRAGRLCIPSEAKFIAEPASAPALKVPSGVSPQSEVELLAETDELPPSFLITAWQAYWFRCQRCGLEAPLCAPHRIERRFGLKTDNAASKDDLPVWRYSLRKHGAESFLDLDRAGYVADSAQLGFGPWEEDAKELHA